MTYWDWIVLLFTLTFIVVYGVVKTRKSKNVNDYLKGGNQSKWWTIGLSVMATQASAITFLSTPGQAFSDGMGFVQFYFGLPLAMVIICLVFIPIYHRLKVYTAYEYLENRFDLKTRTLTALLFLIQRGLSAGITIFAPSIILSVVLGWDLLTLNIIIGALVIIYTVSGGTRAVNITHKQQMAVIFIGLLAVFFVVFKLLPEDLTFANALKLAGANDKMGILDFSVDFSNRYTVWSGLIGGTFLALSYFGTDQSQVQRYLSGKSIRESQLGLIFNGILKVPMQFFILLIGVMIFIFYQFQPVPLNFNPIAQKSGMQQEQYQEYQHTYDEVQKNKSAASLQYIQATNDEIREKARGEIIKFNQRAEELREAGKETLKKADRTLETNDKDYIFIHFIINNLPRGIVGLLLAVIFSAAMSSTASELNALASTTMIDLYRRNQRHKKSTAHDVKMSKWFTLIWGIIAIVVACSAHLFDNLIQLVNIVGSVFYGNVLGVFLLAFFIRYVGSWSVFRSAIVTQLIIFAIVFGMIYTLGIDKMPFLWLNVFGCALVMTLAIILQYFKNHNFLVKT